ncbi:DUF4429 domain-containing protein [Streptomyces boncukensis]|uniref:DUF4429 domain-containing protein n=1 Tax=Streptomyces boncukensis TaxID=2711219 RepID=A0A6G4WX35_9ACTN|nr:DUF4429 domain-containing protein [Streptomyces boncukensis]NGO69846.1 DUF4429 domain-containing protein [Streptomyces boncukensis]
MTEILQRAGSWVFDGGTIRIVPGTDRSVHPLRKALGEVAVPLKAVAGIAYEPGGRKGGRLRLRLRDRADPLSQVAGGRLPDASDPYQLAVDKDRTGVAEYVVEEVRNALLLESVPDSPCTRYLLPGPSVPLTATGTDGTVTFDGERIQIEWNWIAEESKTSGGPRRFAVQDLAGVEWTPAIGWENGSLRFRLQGTHPTLKPQHDPNCLLLWGVRPARETSGSVLLAAAVTARLPHPLAPERPEPGPDPAPSLEKSAPLESGTDGAGALDGAGAGAGTGTGPGLGPGLAPGPGPDPGSGARPVSGSGTGAGADTGASSGASSGAGAQLPAQPGPGAVGEVDQDGLLRRLRELGELRTSGVLTEDEFQMAKKAILDRF